MSLFACVCVCVFVSLAKLHVLLRVLKRNKMSKNNVYKKSKYRQNLEKRTVSAFENRVSGSVFLTCFWWPFKTNSGMLLYSTKKKRFKTQSSRDRSRAVDLEDETSRRRIILTLITLSLTHFEVNSSLFRFVCNNTHLNK